MPSDLVAIDVALLPPPEVAEQAIRLSAALPAGHSKGLRLGGDYRPHITLTQQFVRANELAEVEAHIAAVLQERSALTLRVRGGARGATSVSMDVEPTPAITDLHHRLMDALRGLERPDGGRGAFIGGDARLRDVAWVAGFRVSSSFRHYNPHITLGHATRPPAIEPFEFVCDTVALCHLGRFCSCRHVFRQWTLPR
jgi:2'-5' RNA ligase